MKTLLCYKTAKTALPMVSTLVSKKVCCTLLGLSKWALTQFQIRSSCTS